MLPFSFFDKKKELKHQDEYLSYSTTVKIILDINIGGKSEKIPLTSSMIYIAPEDSSDIFTNLYDKYSQEIAEQNKSNQSDAKNPPTEPKENEKIEDIPDVPLDTYPRLPIRDLILPAHRLKKMKYKEIVQFFFNKDVFAKKMEQWNSDTITNQIANQIDFFYSELVNENVDTKDENELEDFGSGERLLYLLSEDEIKNIQVEKQNIELMLHLLFPTYYFYSEGYKTSMQYWNKYEPYMRNIIPQFSYLRHNGTIYTVTNAIWLNDVFNVPFYRELILYYEKYKNWKVAMIRKLYDKTKKLEKSINSSIKFQMNDVNKMNAEIESINSVIRLLQKNIMQRNEYEKLFKQNNSEYSKVYTEYLKMSISNETKNEIYFYNLIFSKESERILSYSNHKMNDIIYENHTYPLTNNKYITDKELLEIMLENIIQYAIHKGDIRFLKNNICKTEDESICKASKELSTFYYTGILYNNMHKSNEPSYEIYLLIDVIEGEVNKNNIAGIKCKYENQSIGKKIELFTGKWPAWDLSNRRIFMKMSTDSETPLVSNTTIQEQRNSSMSNYTREDEINETQNTLYSNMQTRIQSMVNYDNQQTEPKLRNALNVLKENLSNFPKNDKYMDKVKTLDWSLRDNQTETFLKWLKNENKYPSPSSGDKNNDKYTAIDKQLYVILEKIEKKIQSVEKSKWTNEIERILEDVSLIQSNIQAMIEINRNKNILRLDYINYILEFYVNFCIFLKNYWENQLQNLHGGSKKEVENDLNELYSRIFRQMNKSRNTSQKQHHRKKRMTRKNH